MSAWFCGLWKWPGSLNAELWHTRKLCRLLFINSLNCKNLAQWKFKRWSTLHCAVGSLLSCKTWHLYRELQPFIYSNLTWRPAYYTGVWVSRGIYTLYQQKKQTPLTGYWVLLINTRLRSGLSIWNGHHLQGPGSVPLRQSLASLSLSRIYTQGDSVFYLIRSCCRTLAGH